MFLFLIYWLETLIRCDGRVRRNGSESFATVGSHSFTPVCRAANKVNERKLNRFIGTGVFDLPINYIWQAFFKRVFVSDWDFFIFWKEFTDVSIDSPYRFCLPVVRREPTPGRSHYYLETCRTQRKSQSFGMTIVIWSIRLNYLI